MNDLLDIFKATQPTLTTARLRLRPFAEADAPAVQRLAGAYEVASTTLTVPHPYPDGAAVEWIRTHHDAWSKGTQLTCAVADKATDALFGAIGLMLAMEHARAEVGYWIGVPHWNRGYCTEAARSLVAFGFEALGLHRIQAHHFARNPASGRVMQKLGMQFEGVHRGAFRRFDQFEDVAQYAILATDRAGT